MPGTATLGNYPGTPRTPARKETTATSAEEDHWWHSTQSPCTPKGCLTQMREKAHQAFSPDHQSCLRVQEGGLSGRTGPEEQPGKGRWFGVLQPRART